MAGRNKPRRRVNADYMASWKDAKGQEQTLLVKGRDSSKSGIGFESGMPIEPGTAVRIETEAREPVGAGVVRYCVRRTTGFGIGVEFTNEDALGAPKRSEAVDDYYEVLQISPRAEAETIRRVYRIMAARFHPDNEQTGSLERFLQLKKAFEVLNDPEQRAAYDDKHQSSQDEPMAIFESKDFVDGIEGELNRRLGVLSLLYHKRRVDESHPGVSVLELEKRMSFPREHLQFTIWYLRSRNYVTMEDNSDLILTADGVDYVEQNSPSSTILQRLLLSAPSTASTGTNPTTKAATE
jgi:curved DNA-binding protein